MDNNVSFVFKNDKKQIEPRGFNFLDQRFIEPIIYRCGFGYLTDWKHDFTHNPFWRLYYNFDEGAYVVIRNQKYYLEPEKITLIPSQAPYTCHLDKPAQHYWISFVLEPNFLFSDMKPFQLPLDEISRDLLNVSRNLFYLETNQAIQRKIHYAARSLIYYCLLHEETQYKKNVPTRLTTVLDAINKDVKRYWTNEELAKMVGMSTEGFLRWFKKNMDLTPHRFILNLRLEHSCRLLSQTNDSIEKIADDLGFADRYHFSRSFSAKFKCGPSHYRKGQIKQSAH